MSARDEITFVKKNNRNPYIKQICNEFNVGGNITNDALYELKANRLSEGEQR
jgi:hypothetical protein